MISLFLAWLRLLGVTDEDLDFRLQIHETADVPGAERYWAGIVGIESGALRRTTLKRHNPKTNRRNSGAAYVGCLTVEVRRSTDLYRRIAGWYEGIVDQLGRGVARRARAALTRQAEVRFLAPQPSASDGFRTKQADQATLFEAPLPYIARVPDIARRTSA